MHVLTPMVPLALLALLGMPVWRGLTARIRGGLRSRSLFSLGGAYSGGFVTMSRGN